MMSIFLGHLWIFELNHIVFELEHLLPINILNASILLETIGAVGNNSNSAHNFYQDFTK